MSSEALAVQQSAIDAKTLESVLLGGDLSRLNESARVNYYRAVCESLGLNPLTKPFDYINLNGKLTLYARRDCAEQLRKIHGVSIEKLEKEFQPDLGLYVVTAYGRDKTGRSDTGTGAVNVANLKGETMANAIMKAETKAKRRLTLSICGLGMLDETEVESMPRPSPKQVQALAAEAPEMEGPPSQEEIASESMLGEVVQLEGEIEDLAVFDSCSIAKVCGKKIVIVEENLQSEFRTCWNEKLPVALVYLEKLSKKDGSKYYEARSAVAVRSKAEQGTLVPILQASIDNEKNKKQCISPADAFDTPKKKAR